MDFFFMVNQRQLDQNSELRRIYRVSACYAAAAVMALLLASLTVLASTWPRLQNSGVWSAFFLLVFGCSSLVAYVMMLRALNTLSTNRFVPFTTYAVSRSFFSLLFMKAPREASTNRRLVVLIYALLFTALLCFCTGLVTRWFKAYFCFLFFHLGVFFALFCAVKRTMDLSS